MLLVRLAFREIFHNSRFAILFALSIALGFCGYFTLQSLKEAIERQLTHDEKVLLAGDISISSQRPIPKQEWQNLMKALGPYQADSYVIEFPTMAAKRGFSRLVQVKALDQNFPLYGSMQLQNSKTLEKKAVESLNQHMWAWVDPEVLAQLKLKVGDSLRLGDYSFQIVDVVFDGKVNAWRSFHFVPRVYLGMKQVEKLNMLPKKGSLAFYDALFLLPEGSDLKSVAERVRTARTQAGITIHTPDSASLQSISVLGFLADFLGLASLVSLFLAAIGAAYLLRSYIVMHYVEIAILMCLGMRSSKARLLYIFQAVLLGALSIIPSALLSIAFFPFLSSALAKFTPFHLELSIPLSTFFTVLILAIVGSICIAIPAVESIRRLNPASLLHESTRMDLQPSWIVGWSLVPFIGFMWILSVGEAHSFYTGSLFLAGMIAALVILASFGLLMIKIINKISHYCSLVWRLALRGISRSRLSSLSSFLGVSLACVLINLISQTQLSLDNYIGVGSREELPSLFLFDIDESSLKDLQQLSKELGAPLENVSPLIAAQLVKRNGEKFSFADKTALFQTRESERESFFRNRSFNLSYRSELSPMEKIVKGKPYRTEPLKNSEDIAEISIEKRFADRLGIDLGDELDFDVQGVIVKGKIVNLRKVQWSSFRPNFFVLFQPGVLEGAPKTYLGTMTVPADQDKSLIQNKIVDRFPDVSIVDIHQALDRIQDTMEEMVWAMKLMAWTALATGFFVIFAISRYQVASKMWEVSLMKVLGAPWKILVGSIAIEFGLIAFMAACVGAIVSYLLGSVLAYFIFDGIWAFSLSSALWITAMVVVLSIACGIAATFRILRYPAVAILNQANG